MSITSNGSYRLDTLENPESEKARLKAQAEFMRREEIGTLAACGARQGAAVLDLGCGTGEISSLLAEQVGPSGRVVGIDADTDIMPRTSPAPHLSFQTGRAGALPESLGVFDLVYARFLFQHLPDPAQALGNAAARLAPGGRIAVLDSDDGLMMCHPHDEALSELFAQAEVRQLETGGDRRIGRKLPRLFHDAGLNLETYRVQAFTSVDTPFPTLFHLASGYKSSLIGAADRIREIGDRLAQQAVKGKFLFTTGVCLAIGKH